MSIGYWIIPVGFLAVIIIALFKALLAHDKSSIGWATSAAEIPIDATSGLFTCCLGLTFLDANNLGASIAICLLTIIFCFIQIYFQQIVISNRLNWESTSSFVKISASIGASWFLMLSIMAGCLIIMSRSLQ
jgi:TRAP-type C4-dicarboxylate transport system permease small subunit